MHEGEDIIVHIQRFDQMSMDLLNFEVKMEEEDKNKFLLCSIPSSYDLLVMTIQYGKETLYQKIVSVLRFNEKREWMTKDGIS